MIMAKKFLYFQPEYVKKFKCDGSKCNARCCKGWTITIDDATYKKYSRIKPKEKAAEILSHMKFNSERNFYVLEMEKKFEIKKLDDEKRAFSVNLDDSLSCPFLTEEKLCGIQLEYGEKFLSQTCATYPRVTHKLGKFFERSLVLTCPVAAEKILFAQKPMKFNFVEVSEKVHGNHGKIGIHAKMEMSDVAAELLVKVQAAMISILQERTLPIDQRLIVLCFFIEELEEIYSRGMDEGEQRKLIAAYESKKFLAEQVPLMIQKVSFDAEKFIRLMMELFEAFYGVKEIQPDRTGHVFLNAVINTLQLHPDENNFVSLSEVVTNYKNLVDARKNFLEKYSTFLENYLVNELFVGLYPWIFHRRPTRSLSVFLITYKVFELFMFAATQNNLSSKNDLLKLTDWYVNQIDHADRLKEKIFAYLEEHKDFFELMESLFDK